MLPCAFGTKQFISFGTIADERVAKNDDMMSATHRPNTNRWYVVERPSWDLRMYQVRNVDETTDTDPPTPSMTAFTSYFNLLILIAP